VGKVRIVFGENVLGHAIAAAEIAAVRHTDAQIMQGPASCIPQQASGRQQLVWHQGLMWHYLCSGSLVDQGNDALV
jgi:hypothetical protein